MAEIRCPKCGSRMIIPTTTEDDFRHYVCSNRPTCTERIAVEDAFAYMWEEGRPAGPGAGGIQQSKKSSQRKAGTAVSRLEEGKRWFSLISKRSKRKDKAPVHEVRGDDSNRKIHEQKLPPYLPQRPKTQKKQAASGVKETSGPGSPGVPGTADGEQRQRIKQASPGRKDGRGDDRYDEIHAPGDIAHKPESGMIPQAASRETEPLRMREGKRYKSEQPGALEKEAAIERKELPKAWTEHSREEEVVSEKKTEIHKEKKSSRHWWRRRVRKETAPEVNKSTKTQQSGALSDESPLKKEELRSTKGPGVPIEEMPLKKESPAGPLLQTGPNREVAHYAEESLSPQPRIALKPEIAPEVEVLPKPRPRPLLALRKELATKVKRLFRHWWRRSPEREAASDKPVEPVANVPDRAKESLSPQPPGVMQSDMDDRKKKRTLIIIIIVMAVNCIVVIAGMIYALLVLR